MVFFNELTETFKITKLLKDKPNTAKETKEKLNEIVSLSNAYVIAILSEISKENEIKEEDIEKVFKTLQNHRNTNND